MRFAVVRGAALLVLAACFLHTASCLHTLSSKAEDDHQHASSLGHDKQARKVVLHDEKSAPAVHYLPHAKVSPLSKQSKIYTLKQVDKAAVHSALNEQEEPAEEKPEEEESKVQDGIEMMTEEQQATTIMRCNNGDVMDPDEVVPPNVSVGIYVTNLGSSDGLVQGTFFAEFLFYLRQEGSALSDFEGSDPIEQLVFSNAKSIHSQKKYGAGTYLISGEFFFSPDLRWYPFDEQALKIVVEQMESPITEWEFVGADSNGLSPSVRFPGWLSALRGDEAAKVAPCSTKSGVKVYPGGSRDDHDSMNNVTFSRFTYELKLNRPEVQGLLTHIFPPIVVYLPTLYSYALSPLKDALTKMSLSGGALISLIFISRGVTGSLPSTNYLTIYDKYIFCFFIGVSIALSFTVATYVYFRQEDGDGPISKDLREMLQDLSLKVCIGSNLVIFFVFLPLWMYVHNAVLLPLLLLFIVASILWVWSEFGEIKYMFEPEELSGLQPNDIKTED